MIDIEIRPPAFGLSRTVAPILRALPAWFGIEEATQMYINDADTRPTLLAVERNTGRAVGFLTLTQHSATAAEIHVMAVMPDMHRHGIGRLLQAEAERYLRGNGTRFLQVKTLSEKHPDEGYARTRRFYVAMGFTLLEEFADLWGEHTPCWQLIKAL